MDITDLTPVQEVNGIYLKREDLFEFAGCSGSKVRGALYIIQKAMEQGYTSFVSLGSRFSPQCEIISCICEEMNLKCHLFMPGSKEKTLVMEHIEMNKNTTLHYILKGGYTNVLISRAKKFAEENGFYFINFGMEMEETIDIIGCQVENIPNYIKRVVMPIGSGMNFCAVVNGLERYHKDNVQVVGIYVGKDPMRTICKYTPMFNFKNHKVIKSEYRYEKELNETIGDVILDPIYEAKCKKYLCEGDLFWIVGRRKL